MLERGDFEPCVLVAKAWFLEQMAYKLNLKEHCVGMPDQLFEDANLKSRLCSMALAVGNAAAVKDKEKAGKARSLIAEAR